MIIDTKVDGSNLDIRATDAGGADFCAGVVCGVLDHIIHSHDECVITVIERDIHANTVWLTVENCPDWLITEFSEYASNLEGRSGDKELCGKESED